MSLRSRNTSSTVIKIRRNRVEPLLTTRTLRCLLVISRNPPLRMKPSIMDQNICLCPTSMITNLARVNLVNIRIHNLLSAISTKTNLPHIWVLCRHVMQISRLLNKPHVLAAILLTRKLEVTIMTLHVIAHRVLQLRSKIASLVLANKLLLLVLDILDTHFASRSSPKKIQFFAKTQPKCNLQKKK